MSFDTSRPRFVFCVLESKSNATSVLLGSGQGSLGLASVNGGEGSQCVLLVVE